MKRVVRNYIIGTAVYFILLSLIPASQEDTYALMMNYVFILVGFISGVLVKGRLDSRSWIAIVAPIQVFVIQYLIAIVW